MPYTRSLRSLKKTQSNESTKPNTFYNVMHSIVLLLGSNVLVGTVMSMVYYLGKNSFLSYVLIYLPISLITFVSIRDKYSFSFIFSCILAVLHGLAHVFYPFINEVIGVNSTIDVWQDQVFHLLQSVLFSSIYFNKSGKTCKFLSVLFMMANLFNVLTGYFCWNEHCHNLYVTVNKNA